MDKKRNESLVIPEWIQKDEWYTPREIIESVGHFDLDPCAPMIPLFHTADRMYNREEDGLSKPWTGRVWLNPPYSQPLLDNFMARMAEHNNGIALLFNRCDSRMFREYVLERATAIRFLYQRIKFHYPSGRRGTHHAAAISWWPMANRTHVSYGNANCRDEWSSLTRWTICKFLT